jgi:hypothetical protein
MRQKKSGQYSCFVHGANAQQSQITDDEIKRHRYGKWKVYRSAACLIGEIHRLAANSPIRQVVAFYPTIFVH